MVSLFILPGFPMSGELPAAAGFHDVRQRGFRDRADVEQVLELLRRRVERLDAELTPLADAAGRVLAEPIYSEFTVPGFDRAAMDGYALRGEETFAAGPYNPLEFRVVGESRPGRPWNGTLASGEAVRIMTGAPLPAGADAVVPFEHAEEEKGVVRVCEAVAPWRHVGRCGEDVQSGCQLFDVGRTLRPQDVGLLAAVGVNPVPVVRRPVVEILITGDELLPPGEKPRGCRIVDSNSVMLAALVRRDGGIPAAADILPDRRDALRSALLTCRGDAILVSGGSSVGAEDHAPAIIAELGELAVHGVAMRPSSPAGIGFIGRRPVFLLPGNPVSCLAAYDFFAGLAIRRLGGRREEWPYPRVRLPLGRKLVSAVGRLDYVRVVIRGGQVEPLAAAGASVLSSTSQATGFVIVPRDSEGAAPGQLVEVHLYDL